MINDYGGSADPSFPPTETPKWPEFLISASINQAAESFTELKVYAMNHSAWPTRVIKDLSYNYYFDITEVIEAGYNANDIITKIEMISIAVMKVKLQLLNLYIIEIILIMLKLL